MEIIGYATKNPSVIITSDIYRVFLKPNFKRILDHCIYEYDDLRIMVDFLFTQYADEENINNHVYLYAYSTAEQGIEYVHIAARILLMSEENIHISNRMIRRHVVDLNDFLIYVDDKPIMIRRADLDINEVIHDYIKDNKLSIEPTDF